MSSRTAFDASDTFVLVGALVITSGVLVMAGFFLAAIVFSSESTIVVPFVATFAGFHEESGSSAVALQINWWMLGLLNTLLTLTLWIFARRFKRNASEDSAAPADCATAGAD